MYIYLPIEHRERLDTFTIIIFREPLMVNQISMLFSRELKKSYFCTLVFFDICTVGRSAHIKPIVNYSQEVAGNRAWLKNQQQHFFVFKCPELYQSTRCVEHEHGLKIEKSIADI